jgi:hypothetical protein
MARQDHPGAEQHREQADRVQQFSLREDRTRETPKIKGNRCDSRFNYALWARGRKAPWTNLKGAPGSF